MIIDLEILDRIDVIGLIDLKMAALTKRKAAIQKRVQELVNVRGLTSDELGDLQGILQDRILKLDEDIAALEDTKGKI